MSLCLCKSLLKDGQGGEGFAFHPLYFFLSCPLHPTSGERLRESDIREIDFAPPSIRVWSLDDYFDDTIDDTGHELSEPPFASDASSSPAQSESQPKTPEPFRPDPIKVEGKPVDIGSVKERQSESPETGLADEPSHPYHAADPLPTTAPGRRIVPDQDDWEQYKSVIEDLYMRQNLNLAQVRNVMESNYGIRATPKMYKYRFKKWHWAKYSSKGHRAAIEAGAVIHQREGKSRTKPSEVENFKLQAVRELRRARRQERALVYPLLHQNDQARDFNTILTMTRQYIVGETETSVVYCSSPPTLDSTRRFSSGSGTDMYQTFVSALAAFSLDDFILGGRLLRRAFRALDSEIDHLGLIRSVEYCFSIPHLFVSYGRNDLATLLLKYMAPRLKMIPKRHPLAIICGPLLSIIQTARQPSQDSLDRVLQLGADTFAEAHSDDLRAVLYFRARFCTIDNDAAEEIFVGYQGLVAEYTARFGEMHPTTLSTEREMLDFGVRYKLKPAMVKELCELAIFKIEDYYAKRNLSTPKWKHSHQKLWMDLECLLAEIVASLGDLPQAIQRSRDIYGFVANTSGCLPSNRWYAINSFQIWLEMMLYSIGQMEVVEEFRRSRLSSEQYHVLDKESIDEEQDFLNSHN